MHRGLMTTGALVLVVACSSPDTHCEVKQVVTPSSSREPGTLQYGVLHSRGLRLGPSLWNAVAARSDGRVVCMTCSGIVAFDSMLHETGRVDGAFPVFAVAPDDTVYGLDSGVIIRMADLDHLSAASVQQWPAPVDPRTDIIVAGAEGPYTGTRDYPGVSQSDSVIRGFDAMTGQPRTVASGQFLLAAEPGGGVLTVEQQGSQAVTLRRLDPSGMVVWSRTLSSTVNGIGIFGAAVAMDGSMSVIGQSTSGVDFGDRKLDALGWFLAGFDASGATQWAFHYAGPLGETSTSIITHIAQTTDGAILIAGQDGAVEGSYPIDSTLTVATPAGVVRTLQVGGSGKQTIDGLAAAPDGAVWVYVSSFVDDDVVPDPVLQIGDHTFADFGEYLFKLVP